MGLVFGIRRYAIVSGVLICLGLVFSGMIPSSSSSASWGFFAHKRINRLAVLTLPPEMMVFFKQNIDYITDHAVDPDMRRYASKQEGARHYIDLDHYGQPPFESLPRPWLDAMARYTEIWIATAAGDTVLLVNGNAALPEAAQKPYKRWFSQQVLSQLYRDDPNLQPDSLFALAAGLGLLRERPAAAFYRDRLGEHGILPWNLQRFQRNLTEAFRQKDLRRILRLSADIGHYIGDAHVPLHTCSNYNGQKTNQHGIHGFWESRIPELFADETYDYFVGKPEYIGKTDEWFWQMAFDSNKLVDSVLSLERALRQSFPADRQMCPDMRNGVTGIHPCREFASAYQDAMNGMVERRMRQAIHAVSSAWFSAWVDAGQPDLSNMTFTPPSPEELEEEQQWKRSYEQGRILGRAEDH